MTAILFWILKTLGILVLFQFVIPPLVDAMTRNSWAKFPIFLFFSLLAGAFMARLKYVPYLLAFLWLALTYYSLQAMQDKEFEAQANMTIRKPVFYISHFSYVIMSCALALFFQTEIVTGDPGGPGVLLWKRLLGLE